MATSQRTRRNTRTPPTPPTPAETPAAAPAKATAVAPGAATTDPVASVQRGRALKPKGAPVAALPVATAVARPTTPATTAL
ncbi:MAG: hypothetical protein H7345_19000 [Rubritepida sp.]|nr:hypothetical protein [Rubritepida sp.]